MKKDIARKILKADFESGAKKKSVNFIKRYWIKIKDWGIACWLNRIRKYCIGCWLK